MTKLFLFDNNENLIGAVDPLEGKETNELNKLHTLEVVVNYNELVDKAVFIGHKDYKQKDVFHLYKIDRVDKESTTHVKITAVHKFFDDMESDGYIKDYRPQNKELVGVLTTLLNGSSWQLGTVNVQRIYSGNFYYLSRKEALSKLVEETQIEIAPRLEFTKGKITARYLDVFKRMGRDNGKVFIHGKDLLTVKEKNSKGAIYTAVIGRGKGEEIRDEDGQATGGYGRRITYKDVVWEKFAGKPVDKPAGEEMLEIPALTKIYGFEKGTKPRVKIVEFQDEEDPERLIMLSYEWLKKNSRVQVEYKATVRNVGNLDLGDTVGVYNPKLGIKYKTRVFKVVRNLTDNKLTEFGIGDKVTSSPFSRTIELAKDVKNFQNDTIYWLDKIRERLSDKFLNEDGYNYDLKANNKYELPAGYYSFDKPIDQSPTKVVYMGAGKIAIANTKKPNGEWNWRTFLDGDGATLDLINAGILKAGRIQAADGKSYWDLDTGEFHLEQGIVEKTFKNIVEGKAQEIIDEVKKSIPNMEGLKGKDAYVHKKYSNNADGSNMNDDSNSKYIGIYSGDKKTPPTDPREYSWTRILGEDGVSAFNFNLLKDTQIKDSNAYTLNGANPTINEKDYNDKNSVEINNNGLARNSWKGISFRSDKKEFKRGEKIVIRLPIYIFDDVPLDNGIHLALKSHKSNKQMAGFDLGANTPRNKWIVKEFVYEVKNDFTSLDDNIFFIFSTKNGHFKIAEPYMAYGNAVPKTWMPNVEDLRPAATTNLNYLPNSNFEYKLLHWSTNAINNGLELNFVKSIDNFGDGIQIVGTPTDTFRGLVSDQFKFSVKKDDKYTVSMDILKNTEEDIKIEILLYMYKKNENVGQQSQTMTIGLPGISQRVATTFTAEYDFDSCIFAIYNKQDQAVDYYLNCLKIENGEDVTPWQPSLEDLKAHTLTTNVRFEGKYVNKKTTGVKAYLDVFYDNVQLNEGFVSRMKYRGADRTEWSEFEEVSVSGDGHIPALSIEDKEQNGEPIEIVVLTTCNGISNLTRERLDDKPDIVEITDILEKYKTFDHTMENFNSTIGEFREQVINGGRNLLKDSAEMNNVMPVMSNWQRTLQNGTLVMTKHNVDDSEGVYFVLADFLQNEYQDTQLTWSIDIKASKDITFTRMGQGTGGVKEGTFEITPEWQRFSHTFTNKFERDITFFLEGMQGTCEEGDKVYFRFPKIEKGPVATPWTPAPEDLNLIKERLESSINQTKDELGLMVKKNEVISSINLSVEKNAEGQDEGLVKIKGNMIADDIHGKTFTGSKFIIGETGILDSQGSNFRVSAPHKWGENAGYGMQFRGSEGDGLNQGLNIYRVDDVTNPNKPLYTPAEVGLSVFGEIQGGFRASVFPGTGKLTAVLGTAVMTNRYGDTPVRAIGGNGKHDTTKTLNRISWIGLKTGRGGTHFWVNDGTGTQADYAVAVGRADSDKRLKENIKDCEHNALEVVNKLKFKSFDWKPDKFGYTKPHTNIGLIAQEVEKIQADLVGENVNTLTIDDFRLLHITTKAVQELSAENKELKAEVKDLNARLERLEKLLEGK